MVTGESALIYARVATPDGDPIKAQVRLFKVIEDKLNELALSETGILEVKITPGLYKVIAYIAGRTLAEETVEVKSGDSKEIILVARTVYFEQFGIEPNYNSDTELLAFTRIVYSINNLYQTVSNAEVILVVNRDDNFLEQVSLILLSRLDMGWTGGNYSYLPTEGWQAGNYSLKLELYIEEEFYNDSSEQELLITLPAAPFTAAPFGLSLVWWVVAGVASIVIVIAVILVARRRRQEQAEKRRQEIARIIILLEKRREELVNKDRRE